MTKLIEVCYNVNSENVDKRRQWVWLPANCGNVKQAVFSHVQEKYPNAVGLWVSILSVREKTVNV